MSEDSTTPWPAYGTVGDLPDEQLDELLREFAPGPPGNQAFPNMAEFFRRRALLKPPLTIAELRNGGTYGPVSSEEALPTKPPEAVDVVLSRYYAAAMLENRFTMQIVIGADHAFSKGTATKVTHSRTIEGRVKQNIPLVNVPFLEGIVLSRGALLNLRVIHIDGAFSKKAIDLLKSDAFKTGVKLTKSFNPIFGYATNYLGSVTEFILNHRRNRQIIEGTFGLYNFGGPLGRGIGIGDYLFAQLPTIDGDQIRLEELRWDPQRDRVMRGNKPLDANYFQIRVDAAGSAK